MKKSRSSQKRITRETEVLRYMRMAAGLSMNQAGERVGITSSAIAHIEGGRMGVSRGRLDDLLSAYKFSHSQFLEYLEGKDLPLNYRDACTDLIQTLPEDQLRAIFPMLKALAPKSQTS